MCFHHLRVTQLHPGIAVGLMTKRLLGALKSIILLCAGAPRVGPMGESRHVALDGTGKVEQFSGFHGVLFRRCGMVLVYVFD